VRCSAVFFGLRGKLVSGNVPSVPGFAPSGTGLLHRSDNVDMNADTAEPRTIIVERFALWAAMSAARQGCELRGRKWYEHLDRVDLASLIAAASVTQPSFREWHEREVLKLAFGAGVPIGWAAKMVNMLTKVHIYIAGCGDASLLMVIHPPIDNNLMAAIRRRFLLNGPRKHARIRELCERGKTISGISTYAQYSEVIEGLVLASECLGCTLFEIERLWNEQP
jgi:hypothetical protein